MDFYDVISKRESVRSYDSQKKIDKKTMERVLTAGIIAPSAKNLQPWEFIVVSSEEKLAEIRKVYHREWFKDAPHILVIKGSKKECWERIDGYKSLETDLTIAMDHIILAATSEDMGTCWIAAFDKEKLYSTFDIKDDEEIYAITPLGYPKADYKPKDIKKRKSLDEVVTYI